MDSLQLAVFQHLQELCFRDYFLLAYNTFLTFNFIIVHFDLCHFQLQAPHFNTIRSLCILPVARSQNIKVISKVINYFVDACCRQSSSNLNIVNNYDTLIKLVLTTDKLCGCSGESNNSTIQFNNSYNVPDVPLSIFADLAALISETCDCTLVCLHVLGSLEPGSSSISLTSVERLLWMIALTKNAVRNTSMDNTLVTS